MVPAGRLNVYISPEIHKATKIFAATNDMKISKVVEDALKEYIEKHSK